MNTPSNAPSRAADKESARRVSACVTELLRRQPFFGSLALRLPPSVDNKVATIAADGKQFYYNPEWIKETPADQIQAAMARCVLACALKHHLRRGERDSDVWARASQMATVPIVRKAGFAIPDDVPGRDASCEAIYADLIQEPPQPKPNGAQGAGSGDSGDGSDDAQDSAKTPSTDPDPHGVGQTLDAPEPGPDTAPDNSQGADNQNASNLSGDGNSGGSQSEQEQDWDDAMHQAQALARGEGKMPGNMDKMIESSHFSKADYKTLLRRFMLAIAKTDYSWAVPNRRFISDGLYLPSLHGEGMGPIVLAIDTSGSISERCLNEFWSNVRELCGEVTPEKITILFCDTEVQEAREYDSVDDLPEALDVRGGGGTAFAPVFDWVDASGQRPDCLLYFTDLWCSDYPKHTPDYPVLWMNWDDPAGVTRFIKDSLPGGKQPFGERVDVS